jgi:hypothetical protein
VDVRPGAVVKLLKKMLGGLVHFPVPLSIVSQTKKDARQCIGIWEVGADVSPVCASGSCLALRHGESLASVFGIQIGKRPSESHREAFGVVQAAAPF